MNYYHLVTRIPMQQGQIIDFTDSNHNRLYDFWMKREARRNDGADVFQVLNENDYSDSGKTVIQDYVFNQARAVRETVTELIRATEFPEKPSRLKCLYVCKTLEEAYKWKENFQSFNREILQLVELSSDGKSFTGDAALLPQINGDSFEKKLSQARQYWTGELKGELVETLLGGKIKVERIIEDYTSNFPNQSVTK